MLLTKAKSTKPMFSWFENDRIPIISAGISNEKFRLMDSYGPRHKTIPSGPLRIMALTPCTLEKWALRAFNSFVTFNSIVNIIYGSVKFFSESPSDSTDFPHQSLTTSWRVAFIWVTKFSMHLIRSTTFIVIIPVLVVCSRCSLNRL
jgi:hypothetical protein